MKSVNIVLLPLVGLLAHSALGAPFPNPSTIEMEKRAIPGGILAKPDVVERAIPGRILTKPDVVERAIPGDILTKPDLVERAIPGGILTKPDVVERRHDHPAIGY